MLEALGRLLLLVLFLAGVAGILWLIAKLVEALTATPLPEL